MPHPAPRTRAIGALCLGSVLTLGACAGKPAPEPRPAAPPATPDATLVANLREAAAEALEEDRLVTPPGDNAAEYLYRLREEDPRNPEVTVLTRQIVERLLELAARAAAQERFPRARTMLDRARTVDPENPAIAGVDAQVELLASAIRVRVSVDRHAVAARDAMARAQLRDIGVRAKQPNTRVIIIARSDTEGRWMYRQMRDAPGERRIRAELAIGSPPGVELIVLSCPDDTPC